VSSRKGRSPSSPRLILAIDARLLVLDEPTLGLDLLYRRQFYDTLLNDTSTSKRRFS